VVWSAVVELVAPSGGTGLVTVVVRSLILELI